ncbi:MAG: RES family NAD+ phosphorylase [Jatrophihabitantaceae bacterium]
MWPEDVPIVRCHDVSWGSREFYAGSTRNRSRFSPFVARGRRKPLPVLYGADDQAGALSETIFHDLPASGPAKHVPYAKLLHAQLIELRPLRDLTLIDLTSDGLSRLGLTRSQLIESDPRSYPETAGWARVLHDHLIHPDGLYWVSRQHDTSRCFVLFSDRVKRANLAVAPKSLPLPLAIGAGFDIVCEAADRAGITITGIPGL